MPAAPSALSVHAVADARNCKRSVSQTVSNNSTGLHDRFAVFCPVLRCSASTILLLLQQSGASAQKCDGSTFAGALIWHGRDLRRYKRLLSPPLQRLLTCPGTAALGRGVASMPASYSHQVCHIPIQITTCNQYTVRLRWNTYFLRLSPYVHTVDIYVHRVTSYISGYFRMIHGYYVTHWLPCQLLFQWQTKQLAWPMWALACSLSRDCHSSCVYACVYTYSLVCFLPFWNLCTTIMLWCPIQSCFHS